MTAAVLKSRCLEALDDTWNYLKRADTFPQRQIGELWSIWFGKVVAVMGIAELTDTATGWDVGLISAAVNYLNEAAAYLARS